MSLYGIFREFGNQLAMNTSNLGPVYMELPTPVFERLYLELNSTSKEPIIGYPEITLNFPACVINVRPARKV